MGGAQPTVAPIGTARATQRAGQADVAKQRQQIEAAKADFSNRMHMNAYEHNVAREDAKEDREQERLDNIKNLGTELTMRANARAKELNLPPTVKEIGSIVLTSTLSGAKYDEEATRKMLSEMQPPMDTTTNLSYMRWLGNLGSTGYKSEYDKATSIANIRSAAQVKADKARQDAIKAAAARNDEAIKAAQVELKTINGLRRDAMLKEEKVRESAAKYGIELDKPETWENTGWWTTVMEDMLANYGKTNRAEVERLKAKMKLFDDQTAAKQAHINGLLEKNEKYEQLLYELPPEDAPAASPEANTTDPYIDPLDALRKDFGIE
jgi:hypothetical protein